MVYYKINFIFQFETFSTELRYDKVEVFDGSERLDNARLGIYSGNQVPVVPLASSNVLLVTFTSDFSQQAHGFNVTWFTGKQDDYHFTCKVKSVDCNTWVLLQLLVEVHIMLFDFYGLSV